MRKMTKFLSLACVATMLVSSVAYADGSYSGDGVIENDNSTPLSYVNVVLPTMVSDETYDFKIDIDGLLGEYDKTITYDVSSNVYFNALKTAATAVATTGSIYKVVETVDTDLTKFKAEFTADQAAPAAFVGKYWVWQPDGTTGKGKFTEVTADNYTTFVDVNLVGSVTATLKQHNVGAETAVFDGKLYYGAYTEVADGAEIAEYMTYDAGTSAITAVAAGLYHSTDAASYTAVEISNVATLVTYTPAVRNMINTSDIATIENKSAVPVAVKAALKVKNPADDYLKFVATEAELTGADASLYMAIQTGSEAVAVGNAADSEGNKVANAYYILAGATSTPNKYQSATIDDKTGSHSYYQYEAQNATYDKVDFTIKASANGTSDADDSWDAYVAALGEEEVVKPSIDIVYSFEEVTASQVEGTTVYTDANDIVYTPKAGTSGIATVAEARVETGVAYTSQDAGTKDVVLTFTPGTDAKTLANTSFKINGVEASGWGSYTTNIVFSENTITIKAAAFGFTSVKNATTDNKYTFTVVDTEGTAYSTVETTLTF